MSVAVCFLSTYMLYRFMPTTRIASASFKSHGLVGHRIYLTFVGHCEYAEREMTISN